MLTRSTVSSLARQEREWSPPRPHLLMLTAKRGPCGRDVVAVTLKQACQTVIFRAEKQQGVLGANSGVAPGC